MKGILKITAVSALLLAAVFALSFVPASEAARAHYTCSDTDGGNVPAIFGTVSGLYKNKPYRYSDSCMNPGTIKEYYCNGVYQTSSQQSCGTDGYPGSNYCSNDDVYRNWVDYYCASGACGSATTPTLQQDCGNDGYVGSNYCMNGSVYRNWRDIYCAGSACGYTDAPALQQICEYGCTSGACNPPPADSCSDTDGWDTSVQGTVSGYTYEQPYSYTDSCATGSSVIEWYCAGEHACNVTLNCMNETTTCLNGACI